MTIRAKLLASAVVSTALVVVVGSIGALNRRAVDQGLRSVEQDSLPLVKALEDVRFAGLRIVSSTSEYVLIRTLHSTTHGANEPAPERSSTAPDRDADQPRSPAAESGRDDDGVEEEARLRQSGVQAYTAAVETLDRLASHNTPRLDLDDLHRTGAELLATSSTLLDLAHRGATSEQLLESKELFERQEVAFLASVDRDIQQAADSLNERSSGVRARVTRDYQVSIVALVVASGLALIIGLQVAAAIRRPLALLERASHDIAAGRYGVTLPASSPDEIGAVARAFGSMVDTLGRTTVSKAFVDDIVASIPDGVLVIDTAHRVVRTNPAFVALIGASHEQQVIGRHVDALVPALRHLDSHDRMMTSVMTPSGEVVSVAVTVSPLADTPDASAGYVCLVQDIRDRLAAERALIEAKNQAEAGVRAKSDFLATMSHELRTPLNAIIGYAELLQDEAASRLTPSDQTDLGRIRSSGLLLLGLVNQVLDLAKMEAGKADLVPGLVAPGPLLDEVAGLVGPMLSPQTTLVVEVAPDLAALTTDGEKLRQVLLNLTSNACKFTKAGHVRLTARPRSWLDGHAIEFEVADTGIGMPAEFMQRLFTPFAQAHGSAAGRFNGTGLGMAIAKRLTDLLGATLTVRSTEGRGTVISLLVPAEPRPIDRVAA